MRRRQKPTEPGDFLRLRIYQRLAYPPPRLCYVDARPGQAGAFGETIVRFILGVFVGAALMLGSAYLHDTGRLKVGPRQPFVNWDAVTGLLRR